MYQLKLLGTPAITNADGSTLAGKAAQRHRIALLSLLALSAGRGTSRERLMAYLWPESDQDRARNLLKVSVYVLRRVLGDDAILSDGDELRLNDARVDVDVAAFEAALQAGDHGRAAALYRGPLLDGFHLNGAPDFERWLDAQRDQIASAYAKSLEALAEAAYARGDLLEAVERWKARAAHDPYDSRVALALMLALEASGNPAGALQHAATHERLLRHELGIAPARDVLERAHRLRADLASNASPPLALPFRLECFGAFQMSSTGRASTTAGGIIDDRALAVLAVLAVAGTSGLARERLLLLFWPDVPLGLAQQSLDDLLTMLRSTIQNSLIVGNDIVSLNAAVVSSDVSEFVRAITAGQFARAIELYRGPFLAGFRIDDSPEFEQWLEAKRARFAAAYRDAIAQVDAPGPGSERESASISERAATPTQRLSIRAWAPWLASLRTRWITGLAFAALASITILLLATRRDAPAIEDIAEMIVTELGAQLRPVTPRTDPRETTQNAAARDLYDQGMTPARFRSVDGAQDALNAFRAAVALDSTFAGAFAELALMYARVAPADDPDMAPARRLELAEQSALRAVALDESLASAHAALGVIRSYAFQFPDAERALMRALDLDSSLVSAHEWLAHLYVFTVRYADALVEAQRAWALDSASSTAIAEVARGHLVNGRCEDALNWLDRLANVRPPLLRAQEITSECYAEDGNWDRAIGVLRESQDGGGSQMLAMLGNTLAEAGRHPRAQDPDGARVASAWLEEATAIRDTLRQRALRGTATSFDVATVYAGLGDLDLAFDWLDRAIEDRSLSFWIMQPRYEAIHQDPRFAKLCARLGIPNGGKRG